MRMIKIIAPIALAAVCAAVCSCGNLNLAGATSETTNGRIIGKLVDGSGAPANNVTVWLVPYTYDPVSDRPLPDSQKDTTDAAGSYCLRAPANRVYNILAVHRSNGTRTLIAGIDVRRDTFQVSPAALVPPGAIRVVPSPDADTVNGYLYLPGTLFWSRISNRTALLDSVPSGFIPAVYYRSALDTAHVQVIRTNIELAAMQTVTIADYHLWQYSRKLGLNTTASGAGVASNVYGFPAFIRLTSGNFNFSQARPDGADLRFAKGDNTPLPYEIEQYDAAAQQAAVWVRIDTIFGNSSSQHISMLWGAPSAAAASNGAEVFDTADGFQGVWHLAGAGNAAVYDATINRYNGVPSGMTAASAVPGIIGTARQFNGVSGHIAMPGTSGSTLNFPENGSYTLSAWVYVDSLRQPTDINATQTIFSKGERQYNLDIEWSSNLWHMSEYHGAVGCEQVSSASPVQAKTWKYLCGVRNGTQMALYLDGVLQSNSVFLGPLSVPRNTTWDVQIGKIADQDGRYFGGMIDEVCVAGVARGANWIRLCYMNQKESNALVEFK